MKFSRILFLLTIVTLSFGCSTNEVDEEINMILGDWKLTSLKLEHEYDFNNDGIYSNDLFDEGDCWQNTILTFNEDGTGIMKNNYAFSLTASGHFSCYELDPTIFDWNQEDDTVIVVFGNIRNRHTIQGNRLIAVTPMNEIAQMVIGPNETDNLTSLYIKQ